MANRSNNEVKDSLLEMARIYKPSNPRKFVRDYKKRYRITGGYEDELTALVCKELKLNAPSA
jgi:hypothetical protein